MCFSIFPEDGVGVTGFIVGDRVISRAFSTHPDWSAGFGKHNGFSFVGASAIGQLHLREGRKREDCFLVRSKGEWLLSLVADGVGSARLGGFGASLAVNFFAEEILRDLVVTKGHIGDSLKGRGQKRWKGYGAKLVPALAHEGVGTLSWYREMHLQEEENPWSENECLEQITQGLRKTHDFLLATAQRENEEAGALATTLLGVLFNTFSRQGVAFQIGDGLILAVSENESWPLVEVVEFEVSETAVLTQQNWEEWLRWQFFLWEDSLEAVFLMTDGVADDCLYTPPEDVLNRFGQDLVRELTRVLDEETAARRLLHWLSEYKAPSSFDDRTLVALYR
ncbi:MAG: protein phosphatase 2C domain-containing protein [Candidatus Atribacteria bacterium]|nr:protein phosphatase 2C domain-containing protein [Candidatus Atribacteria bacterium]